MGRLVEPPPAIALTAGETGGDDYATRVAKYIPGEVLAGYVAMGAFVSTMTPTARVTVVTSWATFALCMVLTPVYLASVAEKKHSKALHLSLSTIGFAVWGYALGGPFALVGVHSPQIGSVLLVAFTLIAGALRPKPTG